MTALCVAAVAALGATGVAAAAQPDVEAARQATARYHDGFFNNWNPRVVC